MEEYFMALALEEAKKAYANNEVPIGCVVVKDGNVIGSGYNKKIEKNRKKLLTLKTLFVIL